MQMNINSLRAWTETEGTGGFTKKMLLEDGPDSCKCDWVAKSLSVVEEKGDNKIMS